MSTFHYLTPAEAVAASRSDAPAHLLIVGLKGADADWCPRTLTGQARKPEASWEARRYLDRFKEIARVEWAEDADPGSVEVFYNDGSTGILHRIDLLCVEWPIVSSRPAPDEETAYDGTNWPTHILEVWIMNDALFIDTARSYARFDETGEQLRAYIGRLLFDRDALSPQETRRLTVESVQRLRLVRNDLARGGVMFRDAFERVDWQRIAATLTDE